MLLPDPLGVYSGIFLQFSIFFYRLPVIECPKLLEPQRLILLLLTGRILSKRITFKPYEINIEVPDGENLLRAALQAGVHINASCGGEGVCGKCRVLLESGELTSTRSGLISDEDWDLGYRQACQSWVDADVVIRIPPESLLDGRTLTRRRAGIGLRPSPIDLASLKAEGLYNPAFQKKFVALPPPSL